MRTVENLFRAYAADVLAYALRRTDAATAEDVVSEVFLVAGRKVDRIPDGEAQLWLYGVARRVLANQRRGSRRRAALTSALFDLHRGHVEEPAAAVPVLEALGALRPADQEVLMLTAWEGLNALQAAVVLECSLQAVHTRLHRARRRLEVEIERRSDVAVSIVHPGVPS